MKKIMLPALLALVALGCALLSGCTASGQRKDPVSPPPVPVTVMTTQAQDVPILSDFAAQTYARNTVDVRGRVEGYIEKWLFSPGSEVTAGQDLYELDLRPYQASVEQAQGNVKQSEADLEFARHQVSLLQAQANLASAEANLLKAQQDYARLKPLVEADAASKQDFDAAAAALKANEANVASAKANVEQVTLSTRTQISSMEGKVEALKGALQTAKLNLNYGTIKAPISGRIGDSLVPVGGLVTPSSSQPLTTIVPLDPIWVRFKVTESEYLGWAKQGRSTPGADIPLTLILADNSEFPAKGHIEDSLNQVDPKTGTLELQARFPNPRHTLLPGQFGRVRVQVDDRKNAIVIPQKAVLQLQSIQTVYTVGADNRVLARAVVTGAQVGNQWIIEQGLKPGDEVIVDGQLKVRPGSAVQPTPYRGPTGAPPVSGAAGN
ncbi:MAG TPA: efflux RND transporter periplasmic adaptor subunit [Bryobacteraceae bacterium]|nr:efflux RND transporter periplasmic adaptor subunit [Bryobacteraceae bacterium]